jgi:hypothetical protein
MPVVRRIVTVTVAAVAAAGMTFVQVALPAQAHPARAHHLEIKIKGLHWSCHTKYLVGTFTVSGLKHGQFQVDATNTATSAVLLHTAKAKKTHATLKHTRLMYQFPKGEPGPSGTFNVYVVQGQRQPSPVVAVTINRCRA